MLKVAVLVSGGGTNLQAILDAIDSGRITNAEVSLVISNNPNAYALERAKNHGIEAVCISPKEFEKREEFHKALLKKLQESGAELIVLAGYLVEGNRCYCSFRGYRYRYRPYYFAESSKNRAG